MTATPLTNTGARHKRESSAGVVRKDGTGCEEDDRESCNRDSAQRRPIDKHRSNARIFLHTSPTLVPTSPGQRCRAVPDPAHHRRCPTWPPPRPLRPLQETAACPHDLDRICARNGAPQPPGFRKRGPSIDEAALGVASGTTAAPQSVVPIVNAAVLHEAHQDDDSAPVHRRPGSVSLPAGPKMAGSLLPAIVNLPVAVGAVSPARAAAPAEDPRSGLTR